MIEAYKSINQFITRLELITSVADIVRAYLHSNPLDWRVHAEIIPNYMPPYPRPDTKPSVVVRFRESYLRYSAGPRQGFFWDCYGDDMITVGLAFKALMEAPTPCSLWYENTHKVVDEECMDCGWKVDPATGVCTRPGCCSQ